MKKIALILASLALTSTAFAATPTPAVKPVTAQQQKMKDCNVAAQGKKGDKRKAFMSTCLKKSPESSVKAPAEVKVDAPVTPVAPAKK